MNDVLVLWVASSPAGAEIVEAGGSTSQLVRCSMREVATHALAPATVIAVVDDDRAATEAFGAGVNEVVLKGDLNDEELARAAESAVARAQIRVPSLEPGPDGDEADALGTLLEWLAIELVACTSSTVLEGNLLEENVRRLLARQEPGTTGGEFGDSEADTLEMLVTVRESFRRMQGVLCAVRALGGPEGAQRGRAGDNLPGAVPRAPEPRGADRRHQSRSRPDVRREHPAGEARRRPRRPGREHPGIGQRATQLRAASACESCCERARSRGPQSSR